jgi:hypothetical protein
MSMTVPDCAEEKPAIRAEHKFSRAIAMLEAAADAAESNVAIHRSEGRSEDALNSALSALNYRAAVRVLMQL